jgi:chaperonin GroEL
MHFDRGFLHPDFVTEEKHQRAELQDPYVFICDYKLSSMRELLPLLEQVARAKSSLLIVADDVEGEALATLIVNKKKGTLRCVPVKAPGYADRRHAILEDIAVLTGGTLVSRESGYSLEDVQLSQLGKAKKIVIIKDGTTISGGFGSAEAIAARAEGLRSQIQDTGEDAQREKLMERLARLVGGVAIIRVGGINQQEMTDARAKVVCAMHACHAAIEDGRFQVQDWRF